METGAPLRSTGFSPLERMIEDSNIICGRHRKSIGYIDAADTMTKLYSRRSPDHLDEQIETVSFV